MFLLLLGLFNSNLSVTSRVRKEIDDIFPNSEAPNFPPLILITRKNKRDEPSLNLNRATRETAGMRGARRRTQRSIVRKIGLGVDRVVIKLAYLHWYLLKAHFIILTLLNQSDLSQEREVLS
jgi:hypothetical protein